MAINKSFGAGSDIAARVYADTIREWVPVKDSDSHIMLLNNGFAVRAPGKMYAKVEVPSRLVSDLGFIPGYNIDGGGVKVEYFSQESVLSFTTEKGTYVLDGKKNPELYGEIRDFLLGDNVLLGTAGGMSVDMGKEEKGRGALYKGGVITLSALLMLGLSGCTGTSADTAKEKTTESNPYKELSSITFVPDGVNYNPDGSLAYDMKDPRQVAMAAVEAIAVNDAEAFGALLSPGAKAEIESKWSVADYVEDEYWGMKVALEKAGAGEIKISEGALGRDGNIEMIALFDTTQRTGWGFSAIISEDGRIIDV